MQTPFANEDDARRESARLAEAERHTRDHLQHAQEADEILKSPAFERGLLTMREAVVSELANPDKELSETAINRLRWTLHVINAFENQFKRAVEGRSVDLETLAGIEERRRTIDRVLQRFSRQNEAA